LHLKTPEPDLKDWQKFVDRVISPSKRVKIAVVGKYMDVRDAYKSIYESLTHAAASEDCGIDLKLIDAESLADGVDDQLEDVAGVLIPEDLAFAALKEKSTPRVTLASTAFLFLVSASACKLPRLNSPETYVESKAPTAPSSTRTLRILSYRCWKNSAAYVTRVRVCGWDLAHENCSGHTR
jgi:hypothetical protein